MLPSVSPCIPIWLSVSLCPCIRMSPSVCSCIRIWSSVCLSDLVSTCYHLLTLVSPYDCLSLSVLVSACHRLFVLVSAYDRLSVWPCIRMLTSVIPCIPMWPSVSLCPCIRMLHLFTLVSACDCLSVLLSACYRLFAFVSAYDRLSVCPSIRILSRWIWHLWAKWRKIFGVPMYAWVSTDNAGVLPIYSRVWHKICNTAKLFGTTERWGNSSNPTLQVTICPSFRRSGCCSVRLLPSVFSSVC
jgi:hypothetical protein